MQGITGRLLSCVYLVCVICEVCGLLLFIVVLVHRRQTFQDLGRVASFFDLVISADFSIFEDHDPLRVFGDVGFVRHQD